MARAIQRGGMQGNASWPTDSCPTDRALKKPVTSNGNCCPVSERPAIFQLVTSVSPLSVSNMMRQYREYDICDEYGITPTIVANMPTPCLSRYARKKPSAGVTTLRVPLTT